MNELAPTDPPPYGDYPYMFGGAALPEELRGAHEANVNFAERMVLPDSPGYVPTQEDYLVMQTCATVLTSADHQLGRDTAGLGAMATEREDGLWRYYAMPTFYHNGDGTRLAMPGTKMYMDLINSTEGDQSPYANRQTYLETMLTAAYDDLVFGLLGRGGDEEQSAHLARTHLLLQGFPPEMAENVVTGIRASVFNEKTGTQSYDRSKGAEPVQRGSLVGDLWAAGTPQGSMNAFLLMVENLWKYDLVGQHGQVLRNSALHRTLSSVEGWQGTAYTDFLELAECYPDVVNKFGDALIGNKDFLLAPDRFVDPRITELMQPSLRQNAKLQELIGTAIKSGRLNITAGFQCAASYADAASWRSGQRPTASLGDAAYSPEIISGLLLAPHTIEEIQDPVDAETFFAAFMAEHLGDQ